MSQPSRNYTPMTHVDIVLNNDGLHGLGMNVARISSVKLMCQGDALVEGGYPMQSLLVSLERDGDLRKVEFAFSDFHQVVNHSQRQSVLQAFTRTIQAASANYDIKAIIFSLSLLTAEELLSNDSFYQSLKYVRLVDVYREGDNFSERETQTIVKATGQMSSLQSLYLDSRRPQLIPLLLHSFRSHNNLTYLHVTDWDTNGATDTAHALLGVLDSESRMISELEIYWPPNSGSFTAEKFRVMAPGLNKVICLKLWCFNTGTETETQIVSASRYFHQSKTDDIDVNNLYLGGCWTTVKVVTSILTGSDPDSIGASLYMLTLGSASDDVLEFLATNTSRLQRLCIQYVNDATWFQLCRIIPSLVYIKELTIERYDVRSIGAARSAMLQALRDNGSLRALTIGDLQDATPTLWTPADLRFITAYSERNRTAHAFRWSFDPEDLYAFWQHDDIDIPSEPAFSLFLQAIQSAPRMAPTVWFARTLQLDDDNETEDQVV